MATSALALMLLSGCGTGNSSCPTITEIDAATQQQAARELAAIGEDSALGRVLAASSADRDKIRACRSISEKWEPWRKS